MLVVLVGERVVRIVRRSTVDVDEGDGTSGAGGVADVEMAMARWTGDGLEDLADVVHRVLDGVDTSSLDTDQDDDEVRLVQGVVWSITARIATDSLPAADVDTTVSLETTTAPTTPPSPPSSLAPSPSSTNGIELGFAVHRLLDDYFARRQAGGQREPLNGSDRSIPKWPVLPSIPYGIYTIIYNLGYTASSSPHPPLVITAAFITSSKTLDTIIVPLNDLSSRLPSGVQVIFHANKIWAVYEDHLTPKLRAFLCDTMTRGKWTVFDQLIGVLPPGGSLGLDDKVFVVPDLNTGSNRSHSDVWAEDGMIRFEGGTPVQRFRDPRVVIRCLIEAQMFGWRALLDAFGIRGQQISLMTDYMGVNSALMISQILDAPVQVGSTIASVTDSDPPRSFTSTSALRYPDPPGTRSDIVHTSAIQAEPQVTSAPNLFVSPLSSLPTPPDSSLGSREASSDPSRRENNLKPDRPLHNLPTPASSPHEVPDLVSSLSGGSGKKGKEAESDVEEDEECDGFEEACNTWMGMMDERASWEARLYPTLAREHARLKKIVVDGRLLPPPPPPKFEDANERFGSDRPKVRAILRVQGENQGSGGGDESTRRRSSTDAARRFEWVL